MLGKLHKLVITA